jgi:RNA ligase (TIGR02306 family)
MGTEIKRKLASIQRIEEVRDIENADAIQAYSVLGWWVVDKKDAHKVGDLVVYLSLDSWVPTDLAPFLSKGQEPRVYNGVKGERLRTIKLRGTTSQGLLLKIENCFKIIEKDGEKYINIFDYKTTRSSVDEDIQNSKQE